MKKLNLKLKSLAIAALTVAASMAFATPASAASYYQLRCGYTNYGLTCYYVPASFNGHSYGGHGTNTTSARVNATVTQPSTEAAAAQTTAPTSGLTAAEQQMLDLVNRERANAGLAPLKADLELTRVARLKSQDMINRDYFSHQSPTYGSPFDMIKRFGISYRTAGENIAGNGSVSGAHTSLMNSPGHRANILSTKYTHIGIGIRDGGPYGKMFTQMFVGR
ncbi:MAG: CAP domain-containing protein [Bacillota bacterium]